MYTVKKSSKKENKEKYIKKNNILSSKKNIYKPTSLNIVKYLPILSKNNFIQINNEFDSENHSEKSFTQKIEILDDGSVCKKNTKQTTRIPSPSFGERYFEIDNNTNFLLSENINNNISNEENYENNYQTYEINNVINEDLINNTDMKYNKSLPNLKTLTYTKNKAKGNFIKNKNNEIYIKHKPYNSSGKNKINIKSEKIEIKKDNEKLNYKRALFNKNENFDFDVINQWKYLANKSIMNYNKKILKTNIQIIIQNLKIKQILKKKEKLPTNLIHIITQQKENSDELNKNFFDEIEKKVEKTDKINKYKGGIESINEEMNESIEDQDDENKRGSMKSNKNKQIKINKRLNQLEIKEIESINFSPLSSKSKDIKLFFIKNIQENNKNKNNNDVFFTYKKETIDKKRIKLLFNENKENINNKYNINIKSYKKILKMAFYNKNEIKKRKKNLTKDKYETLINKLINNIIIYKNKNKTNINNNEIINNEIDKKISELEKNVKELKETYIYGLNKIRLKSNENDNNNFIKKLNLTMKRNNMKRIYKEIVDILNNNNIDEKYYQNIIDILKQYEKINEYEINKTKTKTNKTKRSCINIIKLYFIFLPLIFALNYFTRNLKKI